MIVAANWKAYVDSPQKAKKLITTAKRLASKVDIILCMPAPYLMLAAKGPVMFGAQDISTAPGGAQTGEDTAAMLSSLGVSHVIVGHSERRQMGETDAVVLEKVRRALAHGLIPILCVGEQERDEEATYLHNVRAQLSAVFSQLSQKERLSVMVAYEPIWAIGKSALQAIQPADLHEMVLYIRKVLAEYLPGKSAQKIPILYGGSAEPVNARDLAAGGRVDGFLVGHASVESATFSALVKAVS